MSYPGGKAGSGVYQQIINQIPPHQVYIEPFLGGGAVLLHKRPAWSSIGIDSDAAVVAAWSLRDDLPLGAIVSCGDAISCNALDISDATVLDPGVATNLSMPIHLIYLRHAQAGKSITTNLAMWTSTRSCCRCSCPCPVWWRSPAIGHLSMRICWPPGGRSPILRVHVAVGPSRSGCG